MPVVMNSQQVRAAFWYLIETEDERAEAELWSHDKRYPLAIVPSGIATAITARGW